MYCFLSPASFPPLLLWAGPRVPTLPSPSHFCTTLNLVLVQLVYSAPSISFPSLPMFPRYRREVSALEE